MQTVHLGEIRLSGHSLVSSSPRFLARGLTFV